MCDDTLELGPNDDERNKKIVQVYSTIMLIWMELFEIFGVAFYVPTLLLDFYAMDSIERDLSVNLPWKSMKKFAENLKMSTTSSAYQFEPYFPKIVTICRFCSVLSFIQPVTVSHRMLY